MKVIQLIHIKHLEQYLAHTECSMSVIIVLFKCDLTLNRTLLNSNMYSVLSCQKKISIIITYTILVVNPVTMLLLVLVLLFWSYKLYLHTIRIRNVGLLKMTIYARRVYIWVTDYGVNVHKEEEEHHQSKRRFYSLKRSDKNL